MMRAVKFGGVGVMVAALLMVASPAQARRTVLEDPAPVNWGCSLKLKSVKQGIMRAMQQRDWTVQSSGRRNIVARVVVRNKHTLVVDIPFNNQSFDVNYKNSINLNYRVRDGEEEIHPNANTWMSNLSTDIATALAGKCR